MGHNVPRCFKNNRNRGGRVYYNKPAMFFQQKKHRKSKKMCKEGYILYFS